VKEEEASHEEDTPAEQHNESQQEPVVVVVDTTETKKDEMEQEVVDTQTPVSLHPASTEGDPLEPMEAEQVDDRPEGEDSGGQKPIEVDGETHQLYGVVDSSDPVREGGEGVVPLDMVIEEVGTDERFDIERTTEDKEGKEQDDGEPKRTKKNEEEPEAVSDNLGGNEGMQDDKGKEEGDSEVVPQHMKEEVEQSLGTGHKRTSSQNAESVERPGGEEGERVVAFVGPQVLVEAKEVAVEGDTLKVEHEDV